MPCLQIGLGQRPLLGPLVTDAAEVVVHPAVLLGAGERVDALRVGADAVREFLAAALDVAERHDGVEILGILGRHRLEDRDRLVAAVRLRVHAEPGVRGARAGGADRDRPAGHDPRGGVRIERGRGAGIARKRRARPDSRLVVGGRRSDRRGDAERGVRDRRLARVWRRS